MQIQTLRYFIELSRQGSFYAAAKTLLISQQGLNKAITSLESELGCELVERSRRGVRLTRRGEMLLARAERIVAEADELERELVVQDMAEAPDGRPISLHVSFYSAQIAAANLDYVRLLATNSSYIEEPFDKLVPRAAASDGTDLVFLDLHPHTMQQVLANPDLAFEPIIRTQVGFVWKDGSPLQAESSLHRDLVCKMPMAVNTYREIAQLTDRLFRDHPLENIRMGATSPRMLLEYVQTSDNAIAIFDSFGFHLSCKDGNMPTDGLHFTPLSTPEGSCLVGFLYSKKARPSMRARHTVGVLKDYLAANHADYFARYPIER